MINLFNHSSVNKLITILAMPITISLVVHPALPFSKTNPANSALNLLHKSCPKETSHDIEIPISSFEDLKSSDNIVAPSVVSSVVLFKHGDNISISSFALKTFGSLS
jgi:hypothetical protein